MGDVIVLAERRADRTRRGPSAKPSFFFDLACPFSYLGVERVERMLGEVEWIPVAGNLFRARGEWTNPASVRAHAETCAVALRLPLVWPDTFPGPTPRALRAAAYAAEIGAGRRFALAASRLAFCGGFDIEDPEILAEVAAAAGVGLKPVLAAAGDPTRDGELHATSRGLLAHGVTRLPAVRVGSHFLHGDSALSTALTIMRTREVVGGPLAPVG